MFSSRADFASLVGAIVAHLGIAYGLTHMPARDDHKTRVIEMEVRKKELPPPPPSLTPPEPPPPPPPPPERKVTPKVKPQAPLVEPPQTPKPNQEPPKEPPKTAPPPPTFGLTESSTVGDSSFAMPTGNTTMIDPAKSKKSEGPIQPLPATGPPPPKPAEYKPVSELFIKTVPEIDADACGRAISYPDEALQLGVEGDVKLLVGLDERGKVHRIKVLKGLGHGLDQIAVDAMRKSPSCRFSAAVANDGKPAPYELEYLFRFEIPR